MRVAGVPEHFNYPWKLAKEQGIFQKHGVEVEFVVVKEGTGAIVQATLEDRVDIAIALTEGLVASIAKGSPLRLLGTYVQSPLCWAVVAGAQSTLQALDDLKGKVIAISRYGSGSHLMACVLALQRGWNPTTDLTFYVAGDFASLRRAVNSGDADAFMWEHFMTKPFWDSGEVKRIGDITTPWPCFMIAAKEDVVTRDLAPIQRALAAIHQAVQIFHHTASMPATIAAEFSLAPADAAEWYAGVRIAAERFISESAITQARDALVSAAVLPSTAPSSPSTYIDARLAELRRDIKCIGLYSRPELLSALHRRLAHASLSRGPLSYTQLLPYDQHHYHGVDALVTMQAALGIRPISKVLNIGSGLGGPARYLAGSIGCQVVAIELQDDLHHAAADLTSRCGLSSRVHHICGDFAQIAEHLQSGGFDYIVSWLTILHFSDRVGVFKMAHSLLRPGGVFYSADLVQHGHLSDAEWKLLREEVACPSLAASSSVYCAELASVGFKVTQCIDETASWGDYTRSRVAALAASDEQRTVLGEDVLGGLVHFYSVVRDLFAGGQMGGLSVVATRPLGW